MTESTYHVVFKGELVAEANLETVRLTAQKALKLSDQALDKLFSGKPLAVKRHLSSEAARKVQAQLRRLGMITHLHAVESPPPTADAGLQLVAETPLEDASQAEAPASGLSQSAYSHESDVKSDAATTAPYKTPASPSIRLNSMARGRSTLASGSSM